MSNILTSFLGATSGGDEFLKDHQHARALYRDDNLYDLAPKAGWMYYVRLGINPAVKGKLNKTWVQRFEQFVGVLAKSVDLPKFKIATETVNQYNRKTVVQTKLTYDPVSIVFHDDMANATTNLWKNYYEYYFADGRTGISTAFKLAKSSADFADTKYDNTAYAYGLANGQDLPFFTSIEIYQLNKQRYQSFTLLNPIIKDWAHDSLDQSQGNKVMTNKMTIEYEAVVYGSGRAKKVGFTNNHYDNSPSPLSIAGGGTNSLLGPGGIVPGASELLGDFADVDQSTSFLELAGLGVKAANLAKNASKLTAAQIKQGGYSVLSGQLANLANVGFSGYFNTLQASGLVQNAQAAVARFSGGNSSVDGAIGASTKNVPANLQSFQRPSLTQQEQIILKDLGNFNG